MTTEVKKTILIVDDEEPIRRLLRECLAEQGYQTRAASTAEEALAALSSSHFDLVLSDVHMPDVNGLELLKVIGNGHGDVGVLMLTACDDVGTAVEAMQLGALDYVLKPFQFDEIRSKVQDALHRHQEEVDQKRYLMQLEAAVREQTIELRKTFEHLRVISEITLELLVAALDAREHETQAHSKRVTEYTLHLARVMGLDTALLGDIGRGATLHDIGKIGVPDEILLKPCPLTEAESKEMRKHPQTGYWIINGIPGLKVASKIVLAHHEKYDGSGYPEGLKGEEITLGARIFAVIDSFDAITSDRFYRKATSYKIAREEIIRCSGTQFDPLVVKYFLQIPPEHWMETRQKFHP
jgi:cyclic di-GMP phosphodiesterase